MERDFLDLLELQLRVRESIGESFPSRVWVKAEISSLKARAGSHCYIELCQSDRNGVTAKARAVAWVSVWRQIDPYFREVTGSPLSEGMEVLLEVQVTYSELYGFSLVITDIDPEFTLGAKEDARRKTIQRLTEEGLMDLQKGLAFPALPYRIAVISAADAAGYRDFMRHLGENAYGFVFETCLFPAAVQGADAPSAVAAALAAASAAEQPFDIVAIVRGGGSALDLACFDEFEMAAAIARCPIPVVTAVGHDQDFHVADMVANSFVKTPTALAAMLIDLYAREDEMLVSCGTRLRLAFLNKIALMESRIANLETRIKSADPRNILARGWILAVGEDGKVRRRASETVVGESMKLMFPDGTVSVSVVSRTGIGADDGNN